MFSIFNKKDNISEAEKASRAYGSMSSGAKKKMMNKVVREAAEEQANLIKRVNSKKK